jgi:hypothetical protein
MNSTDRLNQSYDKFGNYTEAEEVPQIDPLHISLGTAPPLFLQVLCFHLRILAYNLSSNFVHLLPTKTQHRLMGNNNMHRG